MNTSDVIQHADKIGGTSQGIKAAASVAVCSFSVGLATFLEQWSGVFGAIASLGGFTLSCVLIYVHLKRLKIDERKLMLEERKNKDKQ